MILPAIPVHSFEDATLNFEQLQALGVLGSIISSNAQVAVGTKTVTWAASTSAGTVTVAHGLGRVPVFVGLQPQSVPFAAGVVINGKVTAASGSTFTINAEASAAVTGSVTFYWLAIG